MRADSGPALSTLSPTLAMRKRSKSGLSLRRLAEPFISVLVLFQFHLPSGSIWWPPFGFTGYFAGFVPSHCCNGCVNYFLRLAQWTCACQFAHAMRHKLQHQAGRLAQASRLPHPGSDFYPFSAGSGHFGRGQVALCAASGGQDLGRHPLVPITECRVYMSRGPGKFSPQAFPMQPWTAPLLVAMGSLVLLQEAWAHPAVAAADAMAEGDYFAIGGFL